MKIISSDTMREIDRKTITGGFVSGRLLMRRAGEGAAEEIIKFAAGLHRNFNRRFVIMCGKGNNGGDGFVIARALFERGFEVALFSVCPTDNFIGDSHFHASLLPKQLSVDLLTSDFRFQEGEIIIDCLLGTGLKSELREPYLSLVHKINNSNLPVVSVDIASGLNGNCGAVLGAAVKADLTITIGLPKTGLFEQEGPRYTGRLRCIDIGFPQHVIDEFEWQYRLVLESEIKKNFKRREHDSHKYECGNVLVVGGSRNYNGAPMLAAAAAARCGAGMVSVISPGKTLVNGAHSLIRIPFAESKEGNFTPQAAEEIERHLEKPGVVVVGPGMTGADEELPLLRKIFSSSKKLVVDAGALTHLIQNPELLRRQAPVVLTPHTGELARLCQGLGFGNTLWEGARELAKTYTCTVLIKGQFSRIISPCGAESVNSSGSVALATAGSGDVLAGMVGAFASEFSCFRTAVETAVFVHGFVGECSSKGTRGLIADDLVEELPRVLQSLSPFA